jgi:cytochrome c oxidase assembly protein subunit 15
LWSTRPLLRWLAAATCVGMLLVLVMGAAVTNTGSAEGCGRSWPLCNGQFVPEFTVATAIEYSHRAVTGVETVLILALAVAMLVLWRRHTEVLILAVLMVSTLFLQAGLGAGAVVWPQSAFMLATHFGVSLIAFASTFLSAAVVFERTGPSPRHAALGGLRNLAIAVILYVLAVVYLGAYVRHAGISLACVDWPLCNSQLVPGLDGPSGVVFAHRVAAVGAVVLMGILFVRARGARLEAGAAVVLVVLQALSGALVVWTRLGLFSTLLHAALMGLLFAALAHLVRLTVLHAERNDSVAYVRRLSDAAARGVREDARTAGLHALGETGSDIPRAGERGAMAHDRRGERSVRGAAQPSTDPR